MDRIQKWHEAIGQAKHYAARTTKRPAIALFNDGRKDYSEQLSEAKWLAEREGITIFLINDYVNCEYTLRQPPPYLQETPANYGLNAKTASFAVPASWLRSSPLGHTGPKGGRYYFTDSGTKRYFSQDK